MTGTLTFIALFDSGIATVDEVRHVASREVGAISSHADRSRILIDLVRRGIYSVAEARLALGLEPAELRTPIRGPIAEDDGDEDVAVIPTVRTRRNKKAADDDTES